MKKEIEDAARVVWDYMHMHDELEKADCISVLGSHDVRVAKRAAELYKEGWAPIIVFSGGVGRLTDDWQTTEADSFAEIAITMGVPSDKILRENRSTNTGENIQLTYKLLKEKGLLPKKLIIVQKPYMERRVYATFKKQWPDTNTEIIITSPQYSFDTYPTKAIPKKDIINIMMGDLQRMTLYAEKGFQIAQEIPKEVKEAYEILVEAGYTDHLL